MKPLFLLINPQPNKYYRADFINVWCAPKNTQYDTTLSDTIIRLPGDKLSPLCQGLFACEHFPLDAAIVLSTDDDSDMVLPGYINAWESLINEDKGLLCFPNVWKFRKCAQAAIRAHNPANGHATLQEVWNQAILHGWSDNLEDVRCIK